jgi:glycosyltransferase involved in cell wall biosynthesis
MAPRVVMATMFYPRGGSAHAARALAACLRANGSEVTLIAGSRSDLGETADARAFFGDDVHVVTFDQALAGDQPLSYEGPPGTAPMHPSFEDRPGAPDRVFAALDDVDFERQVRAWSRELANAGAADADVLHLHHLTPLNEAAARVAPDVPVVGQLHGTELLMLEQIARRDHPNWPYAERWAARLRAWARRCVRLVVVPAGVQRALDLLDVPREQLLALPSGVDVDLFRPIEVDRHELWRRTLVQEPRGWLPGRRPGSARYAEEEVERLASGTVLLYAGRFTAVKRLDRLIRAFDRARQQTGRNSGLVLVGGHPGEWEGEHPAELAARLGIGDVFLAGWHSQHELPALFSAADAEVMASEREQFGQVIVEGMACGIPTVATRLLGPASIIEDGRTGWLVAPDDEDALARAMAEVIGDPDERRRRGRLARITACERFAWSGIAAELSELFEQITTDALTPPELGPARALAHPGPRAE